MFAMASLSAAFATPPAGTFTATHHFEVDDTYVPGSNVTSRQILVVAPSTDDSSLVFPLLSFAHGTAAPLPQYFEHLMQLAAHGFVVVAPDSCLVGCMNSGGVGGGAWENFRFEQLRAIDFAKEGKNSSWASKIDWSAGVGIFAHSMGGTGNVLNSFAEPSKAYDIRAAVSHHGFTVGQDVSAVTLPTMFVTGTEDVVVPAPLVKGGYKKDPVLPKAYRNQKGIGHFESMEYKKGTVNPYLAYHTAAWFKIHLGKGKADVNSQYSDAIYKSGPDSFCGNAEMKECETPV